MTLDNEIYIQLEIIKRIRLFFILNSIRKDVESHYKKEDEKRNIINYRDKTNIKKRCTRKPRIGISKETINISGRQE